MEKFVLILMTSQKIVNFNNISRTFLNGYHDGISSFIWKYYIEVESGWKCSICGEVFNYGKTSGSTTNTLKHLEWEHGLIRPEISAKAIIMIGYF